MIFNQTNKNAGNVVSAGVSAERWRKVGGSGPSLPTCANSCCQEAAEWIYESWYGMSFYFCGDCKDRMPEAYLQWRKGLPAEPGIYWMRDRSTGRKPQTVGIQGLVISGLGWVCWDSAVDDRFVAKDAEFYGPIFPPE